MLLSNFAHKLKRVNPKLRVYNNRDKKTNPYAGIGIVGKPDSVCGFNKEGLPRDRTLQASTGHIIARSLRDVLFILLHHKLIDKRKAERVFSIALDKRHPALKVDGLRPHTQS